MAQTIKRKKKKSKKKQGMEFSKKIVIVAGVMFMLTLLDIRCAVRDGYDVSGYATQQIVTTGGILGASIVFYLNKAKIENLSKGKVRFALMKLRLNLRLKGQIDEADYIIISGEIDELENMIDSKLDGTLEEAIQREVDITSF